MSEDVQIVNPGTGEIITLLQQQPPEVLADALYQIRQRQTRFKDMAAALDSELRRRMAIRDRRQQIFGEYELRLEPRRESVWDPEQLEAVLRQLVDDGTLHAGELTGLIRREPTVSRSQAARVLGHLTGAARDAVERCRTWHDKGRPQLVIEPSVQLPAPEDHKEIPW